MKRFLLLLTCIVSTLAAEELPRQSYLLENGIVTEYQCGEQWSLFDGDTVYYTLDNETIADYDAIVDDPFLVIRTKCGNIDTPYNMISSWYNYTRFSPFEMQPVAEETTVSKSPRTPKQHHVSDFSPDIVFDHESPRFFIDCPEDAELVWWQISRFADFTDIVPNCEQIQGATESIGLDPITETFFNSGKPYYFRYRVQKNGNWGDWCSSYSFTFLRPKTLSKITFEKLGNQRFEIRWRDDRRGKVRYWVFASNAMDFIPSIYSDIQLNAATEDQVIAEEGNENLVTTTSKPYIVIDGSYAYYRIVAEKNGCFSTPSSLIRVYDEGMKHQRTILQRAPSSIRGYAKRILFPADGAQEEESRAFEFSANIKPALVHETVWERVKPYLMPLNHPIRGQLDRLFSSSRVLLNDDTLRKAGFKNTKPGMFSKAIISENSKIKGYVFKMFSDAQPNLIDWEQWVRRCYGAVSAQGTILRLGLRPHFVVPKKWIYPLPSKPAPPPASYQKFFICVTQKIELYKKKKSYKKWHKMSKDRLKAIVILLHAEGLTDSNRAFNLPFAKDGRNALIDLEHNHNWPLHFDSLKRWLSSSNRAYLDHLKTTIVK